MWALIGAGALALWTAGLYRFRSWIATGDVAILQLQLERLGDGDVPLVGAYSRLGFNHPGPAREWIFGVFYLLAGGRSAVLPATAILLNLVFAGAALWMARRAGGRDAVLVALLGVVILHAGLGPELRSSWNPYLGVAAGYAAMWGSVAVIVDRGRSWVVPILAASVMAQVHASGLLLGAAVMALTLVAVLSGDREQRARRAAFVVLVSAVAWSGPLLDLARGGDANLVSIARQAGGESLGLGGALSAVSRLILPWSQWQGDANTAPGPLPDGPIVALVVAVLVSVGAIAWAARRQERAVAALASVSLGALVIATISYASFSEPVFFYLFAPISAFLLGPALVVLLAAITLVRSRLPIAEGRLDRLVVAGTAVAAVAALLFTIPSWTRIEAIVSAPLERSIEGAVVARIEPGAEYSIVSAGMVGASTEADVALAVQRHGAHPRSDQFSLGLPSPAPGAAVFVVAMTDPLACLDTAVRADEVVARGIGIYTELPLGVFLLTAARAAEVQAACQVVPAA